MARSAEHIREFLIRNLRRGGIFLAIGGLGFVVDAIVYNALVFGGGVGPLHSVPLIAKTIAVIAGLVVTYAGNKLLTYRDRKAPVSWGQVARYAVVNVAAILVQLACLGFSRYVLGLDSVVADNIAGTFLGQALATGLRYVLYTLWVFPHSPGEDPITYIEEHREPGAAPHPDATRG
ncbi:GtrA family protein [Microbacterium sp. BK668]|uniref:GtrA family protein n=1 Tax=Microbacterium sp. BK668 TaxID=2512118 RepID=UPI0010EF6FF3|nr:GtrA family protein [Microbacterium sp. BK668]TDN88397.1 putative flippase GtrA [Microbacterium sp. BK668]